MRHLMKDLFLGVLDKGFKFDLVIPRKTKKLKTIQTVFFQEDIKIAQSFVNHILEMKLLLCSMKRINFYPPKIYS